MSFDKYLLEQGYVPYVLVKEGKDIKRVVDYNYHISSMVNVSVLFKKGDSVLYYGLGEKGYPPHFLNPLIDCTERSAKIVELHSKLTPQDLLKHFNYIIA